MAIYSRVICAALLLFSIQAVFSTEDDAEDSSTHVVTLDVSNFEDVVSKHHFIVVEFYAPWYGSICLSFGMGSMDHQVFGSMFVKPVITSFFHFSTGVVTVRS